MWDGFGTDLGSNWDRLEIDLGSEKPIDRIQFFNRTDNGVGNRLKNFWVVAYDAKKQPVWVKRGEKTPTPKWESNLPLSFERFTKEDNASVISFLSLDNSKENEKLQKRIKGIEKQLKDYNGDQVPKVMVMDDNKTVSYTHLTLPTMFEV